MTDPGGRACAFGALSELGLGCVKTLQRTDPTQD
jgi:hypothetical protein